ncbi:MAG: glycosyltransferase family 4 protein [Ruminococcaceae bacterium]|nr:glycosyltransferase family 4 protein [Oscillospiraceae bacterium]
MKKHIVVMLGGYYPVISPGSMILDRLIDIWKKEYDVTIISTRNVFGLKKIETIDGINIHRVYDFNRLIHNELENKIKNTTGLYKHFFKACLRIKQVLFYIYRVFRLESIDNNYVNRLKKEIKNINNNRKIDILISTVDPHENSAAAYLYAKKNNVKWFIYQLDRFANANSLYETELTKKVKMSRHYKRECSYLEKCEKLFVLKPIMEHYREHCFNEYLQKIIVTDHPLLCKPAIDVVGSGMMDSIRFIYAGSLDKKLRNPTNILKIFSIVYKKTSLKLDFFSFGNCSDILEEYHNTNPTVIENHNRISREGLVNEICRSDVIVSIGNNSDNEVPSKTFDYLSYGLPIVHFYSNPKDPVLEYMKIYPMAICLYMGDESTDSNVKKLIDFCSSINKRKLDFKEVEALYPMCTPEFVSKMFTEEFNK